MDNYVEILKNQHEKIVKEELTDIKRKIYQEHLAEINLVHIPHIETIEFLRDHGYIVKCFYYDSEYAMIATKSV